MSPCATCGLGESQNSGDMEALGEGLSGRVGPSYLMMQSTLEFGWFRAAVWVGGGAPQVTCNDSMAMS